jgi:hypothetical protein
MSGIPPVLLGTQLYSFLGQPVWFMTAEGPHSGQLTPKTFLHGRYHINKTPERVLVVIDGKEEFMNLRDLHCATATDFVVPPRLIAALNDTIQYQCSEYDDGFVSIDAEWERGVIVDVKRGAFVIEPEQAGQFAEIAKRQMFTEVIPWCSPRVRNIEE